MKPLISKEKLVTEFESEYVNVYEHPFGKNGHYYTVSRKKKRDLVMFKTEQEYKEMLPDAVTIAAVMKFSDKEPRLLLNYEFRYATAEYILAPPAGLIDEEDMEEENPVINAVIRELYEETGLKVTAKDSVYIVNNLLFSSPGMTDESNAIACVILTNPDFSKLNHDAIVGSENFDGFEMVTLKEAEDLIRKGRDKYGNYFSVYTYACLMYFLSKAWDEV